MKKHPYHLRHPETKQMTKIGKISDKAYKKTEEGKKKKIRSIERFVEVLE